MSKLIILPFAAAAAAAAAPVIAVATAVKKVSDAWSALSPEDKSYLLPFGAAKERLRLEQASVNYEPLDGFEFNGAIPDFDTFPNFDGESEAEKKPASVPQLEYVPSISFEEEALKAISSKIEEAGFKTQQRALPEGANVAVFDLFQPEALEPIPVLARRLRHGVKSN
jgi:hypothetical protein